jgi:hypothetical protein
MLSFQTNSNRRDSCALRSSDPKSTAEKMRALAYSMDILAPGLYIWAGSVVIRIGGCIPDDTPYRYPGMIHSRIGIAVVLPGYHIFTTYSGTYDSRQASD